MHKYEPCNDLLETFSCFIYAKLLLTILHTNELVLCASHLYVRPPPPIHGEEMRGIPAYVTRNSPAMDREGGGGGGGRTYK